MKRPIVFLILTTILLIFQNCQLPDSGNNDGGTRAEPSLKSVGFPYEHQMDTVSYMSCSGDSSPPYHTEKYHVLFSALREGSGLKLTKTARDFLADQKPHQQLQSLSDADDVADPIDGQRLTLFLAPDEISINRNTEESLEINVSNFYDVWPSFDDEIIAKNFISQSLGSLRYLRGVSGVQNYFQGRIVFDSFNPASEKSFAQLASDQNSFYMANRDCTEGCDDNSPLVLSLGANKRLTGKKYKLTLTGQKYGLTFERTLASVTSTDLQTNKSGGEWACPESLQFEIVRYEDALEGLGCPEERLGHPGRGIGFSENLDNINDLASVVRVMNLRATDLDYASDISGYTQLDHYRVIRSALPHEYWSVNFRDRCVVSKRENSNFCYGDDSDKNIRYGGNLNNPAIRAENCDMGDARTSSATRRCPHFVSFCVKK